MEYIPMVDLKSQYTRIQSEIDVAIMDVVRSTSYINGSDVQLFAEELSAYLDCKYVIPCANGTDALLIALMSLDLKPSDEVIVPSFTFASSAEVVALLGLQPVFVDVDYDHFTTTFENIRKAISIKTKAIMPVHLFGQCCDMESILALAQQYDLYVIEDNAQAIGATYTFANGEKKYAGTIGHIGCTSFFPSKNLGCYGDGGALFTNDEKLATRIRMIANHGAQKPYQHQILGVNSRLDTIQAAVLRVKLKYLDEYNQARKQAAELYTQGFSGMLEILLPQETLFSSHVYHQYTIRVLDGKRDALMAFLTDAGIASKVYYQTPLHSQQAFLAISRTCEDLGVSIQLSNEVLSLPMHTELTQEQQDYVIEKVKLFFLDN